MRIISGLYRGKRIAAPKNLAVRPTTDFAKEGLFNILNNYFDFNNLSVLDLFGGTGNITYEFASRGAKEIWCVENNFRCIKMIKKTTERLQMNQVKVINSDVFKFLKTCNKKFDIIFADPPYTMKNIEGIPEIIFQIDILKNNGWLVFEHSKQLNFSEQKHFLENRTYGNVNFSILTH